MKNILVLLSSILLFSIALAQDANTILAKVDYNMSSRNRYMESSMTINGKRNSRTLTLRSWSEGTRKSFSEYLSPVAEKGTKMLKLEGQLWIYSPSTDRIIQISGHMLRQSVMGSDLSYEDLMDDRKLTEMYIASIEGKDKLEDRPAIILTLKAKVPDVAYYSQKIWVDAERFIPLKQLLYAKSGELLKRVELKEVKNIQSRWYPTNIHYQDMLKQGKGTEFKISAIKFDLEIPGYIFSKAALKQ